MPRGRAGQGNGGTRRRKRRNPEPGTRNPNPAWNTDNRNGGTRNLEPGMRHRRTGPEPGVQNKARALTRPRDIQLIRVWQPGSGCGGRRESLVGGPSVFERGSGSNDGYLRVQLLRKWCFDSANVVFMCAGRAQNDRESGVLVCRPSAKEGVWEGARGCLGVPARAPGGGYLENGGSLAGLSGGSHARFRLGLAFFVHVPWQRCLRVLHTWGYNPSRSGVRDVSTVEIGRGRQAVAGGRGVFVGRPAERTENNGGRESAIAPSQLE